MLNLNASLTKAGVTHSTLWSENFTDSFFMAGLKRWMKKGSVKHDLSHVTAYKKANIPKRVEEEGREFAKDFRKSQPITGVFDEGCMGMYNAIIPDELLHETGVFKERLRASLKTQRKTVAKICKEKFFLCSLGEKKIFYYETQ
jgi:hypothetical protein